MPYCKYHRKLYRRNMDASFRQQMRDPLKSRDEKLQLLLLYSQRSGIPIGDLEVYQWEPDEYTVEMPREAKKPESEVFGWRLSNGYSVVLAMEWSGYEPSKVSFVIREPQHVFGSATLHEAVMRKYRLHPDRTRALFATGSDLPYPSAAHAYLLPQKPYSLAQVTQILLLEALAASSS